MGNKKRNQSFLSRQKEAMSQAEKEKKDAAYKKNRKYLIPLALNTVLFYGVYGVLSNTPACTAVMWIYAAALLGFALAYVIYNHGFYRKNITPEMLPSSMSDEEKQAFIDEGKRRNDKSKWMITIIFPLVVTFMIDMVILFMIDPIIKTLGL